MKFNLNAKQTVTYIKELVTNSRGQMIKLRTFSMKHHFQNNVHTVQAIHPR